MNTLPRDLIRLLVFKYINNECIINCLKVCHKIFYSFTKEERNQLIMRSLTFQEKQKQLKYINKVIQSMTVNGIKENERRLKSGQKLKKYNYYFCYGCANPIRPGSIRGVRHDVVCKKLFHNCIYCGIPFTTGLYSSRSAAGLHGQHLFHQENTCPKRLLQMKK